MMQEARPVAVLAVAALAGCVAGPVADQPRTGQQPRLAATLVGVDGRDYLGSVQAGPNGVLVHGDLAEATTGASVTVVRAGLLNSDGIAAKKAAMASCALAGGVYDAGALGRFVTTGASGGAWVFDGSCN
jgi:hypothetical protein